jgi:transglutaminase-like putative cysteine protease
VIRAPPGRLTISFDFLVKDSGNPDDMAPDAAQSSLETLPVETLVYLLGSRYCDTDRLSEFAWSEFGKVPKGWPLVQAICDFVHDHITFGYQHANPTKTAYEALKDGQGVCRDFAHLAITLCRCMNMPARLLHRLSWRHRGPARSRAHGFQRLVRGLSRRPLVHLRRTPQHPAHRTHPDRARTRRDRRGDYHFIWSPPATS